MLIIAGVLCAPELHAQRTYGVTGPSLGVLVGTVGASYEDFAGTLGKFGYAGFVRWVAPSGLGVAASLEFGTTGPNPIGSLASENSRLFAATLQPTLIVDPSPGGVNPYVALRFAWYRREYDEIRWEPQFGRYVQLPISASGPAGGAMAGVQSVVTPGLAIHGQVVFDVVRLGNHVESGSVQPSTSDWFTVMRLFGGVSLQFGAR